MFKGVIWIVERAVVSLGKLCLTSFDVDIADKCTQTGKKKKKKSNYKAVKDGEPANPRDWPNVSWLCETEGLTLHHAVGKTRLVRFLLPLGLLRLMAKVVVFG